MSSSRALHRLAEQRSLALHRVVAERLRADPALLDDARERVRCWLEDRSVAPYYAMAWDRVLSGSLEEICAFLVDGGDRARALRQVTPFSGVVDPRTRWGIWREVRHGMDAV